MLILILICVSGLLCLITVCTFCVVLGRKFRVVSCAVLHCVVLSRLVFSCVVSSSRLVLSCCLVFVFAHLFFQRLLGVRVRGRVRFGLG